MKFCLSIALVSFMMIGAANAQSVNFGIKAGLNVFTINDDGDNDYSSRTGFHAGLLAHIHLDKQWALQPELVYSQQGAKLSDATLKLDYLNVPVMVQYMFDNGFRLQAGPQVGFLLGGKVEEDGEEADVKDQIKGADFGVGVGAGYVHVPSGWGVDARYNFGLSNINEEDGLKSMNRGFQVGVFYLFKHRN